MNRIRRLTLLLLLASTLAVPMLATEPEAAPGDAAVVPEAFEKHYLVLLVRPENPPTYDEDKSAEIQSGHLAHLHKLWVDGDALIAGPFEVPDDERMRGMVLYRGDLSTEEVRALAEDDPAVKAGRLEVQLLPWWHGDGLIQFTPPPSESSGE